jgi:hypothetical protein
MVTATRSVALWTASTSTPRTSFPDDLESGGGRQYMNLVAKLERRPGGVLKYRSDTVHYCYMK